MKRLSEKAVFFFWKKIEIDYFHGMKSKAVFKTYNQDQLSLFPLSYDELVPKNHPVRLTSTNDPRINSNRLLPILLKTININSHRDIKSRCE
jgi:hypothetical protein